MPPSAVHHTPPPPLPSLSGSRYLVLSRYRRLTLNNIIICGRVVCTAPRRRWCHRGRTRSIHAGCICPAALPVFFGHVRRPKSGGRFSVLFAVRRPSEVRQNENNSSKSAAGDNVTQRYRKEISCCRDEYSDAYYPGISSRYLTVFGPKCKFH